MRAKLNATVSRRRNMLQFLVLAPLVTSGKLLQSAGLMTEQRPMPVDDIVEVDGWILRRSDLT